MAAGAMDAMADRYADRSVRSVFVYTNEAHPGEGLPRHDSSERKRSNARAFVEEHAVRRPVLLDALEGPCHRAYGGLSNMTWIMARGGVVVYKAAWTDPGDVEAGLSNYLEGQARRRSDNLVPTYTERVLWHKRDDRRFLELSRRAGHKAILDMYGRKAADEAFE